MKQRSILFLYMAMMASVVWAAPKPKPVLYIPMDYSTCGYRASEQAIPDVKNVVYVDKAEDLQTAIDYVSAMKPEKRGAILIGEGTYFLDEPLRISQCVGHCAPGHGQGEDGSGEAGL